MKSVALSAHATRKINRALMLNCKTNVYYE